MSTGFSRVDDLWLDVVERKTVPATSFSNSSVVGVALQTPDQDLRLIRADVFLDFGSSLKDSDRESDDYREKSAYGRVKGALLAAYHFFERISTVVPELNGRRFEQCNIQMTVDFHDTKGFPLHALRTLVKKVHLPLVLPLSESSSDTSAATGAPASLSNSTTPSSTLPATEAVAPAAASSTGVISADFDDAISTSLASVNGVSAVPQISALGTISNPGVYPFTIGMVGAAVGQIRAGLRFLQTVLGVSYLGILHGQDETCTTLWVIMQTEARKVGINLRRFSIDAGSTTLMEEMTDRMEELKDTDYRYFVAVLPPDTMHCFLETGHKAGVLGDEYFWLFGHPEAKHGFERLQYPKGTEGISDRP